MDNTGKRKDGRKGKPKPGAGTGSTLLKGAAILGMATVISKLLGTLQKIPLQNIAGDEVFGIYNAVYPLYLFILTLASAGFPIAVSRFVAEAAGQGNMAEARLIFRRAAWILVLTGTAGFAVLYTAADGIAVLMGVEAAATGIRSVSFALLAAPLMAAVRGYFQGLQDMVPTAVTQVVEQVMRVAVMLLLLFWLTGRQEAADRIAAGAVFGSAAGAAAGLLAAWWFWIKRGRTSTGGVDGNATVGGTGQVEATALPGKQEPAGVFLRRFALYAVPVCLGSLAMPVLTLVDTFTIPRQLIAAGEGASEASRLFGVYNHGLPLVQLVTMVATSMAAALVPAVAQAKATRDPRLLATRVRPVLRFTWLAGLAAAFGLAATALPVNVMLFASPEGWPAMALVSFTALFATLHIVSGCVLQGLGAVRVPARSLFLAAAAKTAGNLLLVPAWGIGGAAASAVLAYGLASALNLRTLKSTAPETLAPLGTLRRPVAAACVMALAVLAVEWSILHLPWGQGHFRLRHTVAALAAVAAGAAVYGAALLKTGALTEAELALVPGFHSRWKPLLRRWRLLPETPHSISKEG
ncbi:putative polysaccharide biosynthesis protein [Paenibacillus mesotrionivorans]|uniref:Oligosaccharide flippase family protein n=1 Tax=Paenibacillus mesotrionivorans TaxID=3160968 RepID=A0ACC7P500_9BACL